jgi:hypothetical protein
MSVKSFQVTAKLEDGRYDTFSVESLNESTLKTEFAQLEMGQLVAYSLLDSNGNIIKTVNLETNQEILPSAPVAKQTSQNNVSTDTTQSQYNKGPVQLPVQSVETFNEVELSTGEVIRVFSNGRVQEQTWKDLTINNIISETGIRIMKKGKVVNELPKDYSFQKLIWVDKAPISK